MQQNERHDYADANIIDKNDSAFIRSKRDLVHSIFRHQMLCRTRNLYSSNFRNIKNGNSERLLSFICFALNISVLIS